MEPLFIEEVLFWSLTALLTFNFWKSWKTDPGFIKADRTERIKVCIDRTERIKVCIDRTERIKVCIDRTERIKVCIVSHGVACFQCNITITYNFILDE